MSAAVAMTEAITALVTENAPRVTNTTPSSGC